MMVCDQRMVKMRTTQGSSPNGSPSVEQQDQCTVRLFQGQAEKGQDDCWCQDENLEQGQVQNEINTGT